MPSMPVVSPSEVKLQEIHQNPYPKTIVIVVPGVGTSPPSTWFEGKGKTWSSFLSDSALPSPRVYQFNHGLGLDTDPRIWTHVLENGLELLAALLTLFNEKDEVRKCVTVFIAHSLGGIMCLTQALEGKTDFGYIARSSAIFISLGTPHSTSDNVKDWCQPQFLIGTRAYRNKGLAPTADDAKSLANLCLRFETVASNLYLLTLCETRETIIKRLFAKANKVLIVPENMCRVNSPFEEFILIDSNHLDIAKVAASGPLENSIKEAVTTTLARIEKELIQDSAPSLLEESTIASLNAEVRDHPNSVAEWVVNDLPSNGTLQEQFWTTSNQNWSKAGIKDISTSHEATFPSTDSKREASLSDFSAMKRDPLLPCHIIPHTKNRDFHDREEVLDLVEKHLAPIDLDGAPRKCLKKFALCGPGGIGKTQVANEFALTHTEMYDAILWVHAEEQTRLSDEFSRLAEHLDLVPEGSADAMDPVLTRELVKGWLAKPVRSYNKTDNSYMEEVSWLLIFDNVVDMDLLHDVLPGDGTGSVLVTSRDHLAKSPFYGLDSGMDLPQMSEEDASGLLLKITWREDNKEEQRHSLAVADKLGGLPLALTQMAGVMVRQNLSFSNFLDRYEEEEKRHQLFGLSLEPKHRRTNYGHTLASVWALEELKLSSGLMDVLSFLDPNGIPEKYLEGAVGTVNLAGYPSTVTEYQEGRSELLKSSLITVDQSLSSLTVHRLIQDAARTKMDPDRMAEVFSAAANIIWLFWPQAELGVRHHIARWRECEAVSPHILRLKDHYKRAGEASKSVLMTNLTFAMLLNELGWYFQERGNTAGALDCYRIAEANVEHIMALQKSPQPDSSVSLEAEDQSRAYFLLAEIHNNTAGSATEFNNPQTALHHFQIYNKMLSDKYGGQTDISDSRLTSSYFNLGMSHTMAGDYEEAVKYITQALSEAERLGDPVKVKAARSLALINLGLTLWLMNRHEDASTKLETALKEREALLGPNDRQSMITGRVFYGIGNVRRSQGLLDQSLHYHERALAHFKETVGNNHHRTGNSCFKVAQHYSRTGSLQEAIKLLDQAVKIFDRHECYTPEKGRATLMKSIILAQEGNAEESKDHLQQAVSLYEKVERTTVSGTDLAVDDFDRHVHVWGR